MRLDFSDEIERPYVVFAAGEEADVAEGGGVGEDGVEDVAEHSGVGRAVLGLGDPVGPGDVEDVRDIGERGKLGLRLVGIGDVALDVFDGVVGVPGGTGTSRHAVDFPWTAGCVGEREDLGEAVSDYARHSNYQSNALDALRTFIFFKLFLR